MPIPPPSHPTYNVDQVIREALEEDSGESGDITSNAIIPEEMTADAHFLSKGEGVLAGVCIADRVLELVDPSLQVTWHLTDGAQIQKGKSIGQVIQAQAMETGGF